MDNKNIVYFGDVEKFDDEQIKHISMRKQISKNKKRIKGGWHYYYNNEHKLRKLRNKIDRYLEKNVGNNIDVVIKEFIERNHHNINDYCHIIDMFSNDNEGFIRYSRGRHFYVDNNGFINIKRNEKYNTFIVDDNPSYCKHVNIDYINKHIDFKNAIIGIIGIDIWEYVVSRNGILQEHEFHRIFTEDNHKYSMLCKIIDLYRPSTCRFWDDTFVFSTVKIFNDEIKITRGSKEYKKYFSEKNKNRKKLARNLKHKKEEELQHLLTDITSQRKNKENEKNIIDRDRLGFNDESFKGEPYHGQKRKKKNNHGND